MMRELRPEVEPKNDAHRKFEEARDENNAILVMKHDTSGSHFAASVQVFHKKVPPQVSKATALQWAAAIARRATKVMEATMDADPRPTTLSGFTAAEWSAHYTLTEKNGAPQPMWTREFVVLMPDATFYSFGYAGPADDTTDAETFDAVVKSIAIAKK